MMFATYSSPFGQGIVIIDRGRVKNHLWGRPITEMEAAAKELAPGAIEGAMPAALAVTLEDYFDGRPADLSRWAPADSGCFSGFADAVYRVTGSLKWGETATYSDIAAAIGRPKAVRAVGTALGRNPIPLFVPCHRVLAKNGEGGWSGPPGLKAKLLALEKGQNEIYS